jgi:ribosome-binding factor A
MDELRTRRVAESMREELSEIIRYESSDPRLADVDVTEVVVASDMHRADVLVALPPDQQVRERALAGLQHARHYLRRLLMQRLNLFRMPELRFYPDSETTQGAPVEHLLRRVRRGRPRDPNSQA